MSEPLPIRTERVPVIRTRLGQLYQNDCLDVVGTAIRPTNLNVGRTMPSIERDHFLVLGASGYNHLSPKELDEASRRTRKTPRSAMKDILDFLEETTENPNGGGTLAIIGHA